MKIMKTNLQKLVEEFVHEVKKDHGEHGKMSAFEWVWMKKFEKELMDKGKHETR